ncbi:dehydrogenase [Mesorhizobium sp. ESP-6-2]|uniref:Rz1-like lysis system protein LysC n=1 Tax=Mesorhizobium sp. ESP-6-2 TaxID=2876625 RepID=UPI001CCC3B50|nr:dehydrogenase [Mesorhizobium sp. ESP-6-2]MBZ9808109.1 dehydrogenase [Mesorhizobium sp. ESP-6-2]
MKRTLTLIAIAFACLAMQGCVSTRSISTALPPALVEPARETVAACLGPVRLPKGVLTQRDVERLWISDRKALITCAKRHAALRDFYAQRDAELRGVKK